jgi:hypothetical protein
MTFSRLAHAHMHTLIPTHAHAQMAFEYKADFNTMIRALERHKQLHVGDMIDSASLYDESVNYEIVYNPNIGMWMPARRLHVLICTGYVGHVAGYIMCLFQGQGGGERRRPFEGCCKNVLDCCICA